LDYILAGMKTLKPYNPDQLDRATLSFRFTSPVRVPRNLNFE